LNQGIPPTAEPINRLIQELNGSSGIAGFNKQRWSGMDYSGDRLANGVYFYKIIAKNGEERVEVLEKCVIMR